jgi:hypothetical protein
VVVAPEKGTVLVHLVGVAQSLGLFFVVCLATAAVLGMAMVALARMERATMPARVRRPISNAPRTNLTARPADRVSSRGSCTYGQPGR